MDAGHLKAFRVGLIGALGVGADLLIWSAFASLATVLSYLGIALFIALGLDPIIGWLEHPHLPRPAAVAVVLIPLFVLMSASVLSYIPQLIAQAKALISRLSGIFIQAADTGWVSSVEQLPAGCIDVNALVKSVGGSYSRPANLMTPG